MKAEAAISDLLMKCEEQGVQMPENPWQALRETIAALRDTKHHALGYVQIPKAFDQLKRTFNKGAEEMETETTTTASPRVVHRQKRTLMQDMPKRSRRKMVLDNASESDESPGGQAGVANVMSPLASSKKKTKYPKKSRIQEQVEAAPAVCNENQPLVDQLVQLGEYEVTHGYTQRGLARFRAAKEIRDSQTVITSGAQAKKLDRVGPVVATKVDQLLNEGLAAALTQAKQSLKKMNLRQAQRSLAELVAKCEAAHIQLPERMKVVDVSRQKDPLEARAEAVEAIVHSIRDGKVHLNDAQDELQQKYGFELEWEQHMENEEAKRQRRRQSHQRRGPNRVKDVRLSNPEFAPEAPPVKDQGGAVPRSDIEPEQSAHGRKLKGSVTTPSKRPAARQERQNTTTKGAKKVKNARELIVPGAPKEAEEKPPPTAKKPAKGMGNILGGDDSSGAPDDGIPELLDLEDLDEVEEGGSNMSSDEDFAL